MKIHISIEAESPIELMDALKKLSADSAPQTVDKPREAEPKKPRTAKPAEPRQPETAPTEDAATPPTPAADPAPDIEPEAVNVPTVVELRAAAQEKGNSPEGKKAIKDLLNRFGSPSISALRDDQRAAFMAALEEL